MKNKFFILDFPKYSIISFIFLNILAMIFYPGGNINDSSQVGYSFQYNFFSDLGTTVSYSNESNLISCILFNSSLCIIGVCFSLLFFKLKDAFKDFKLLSILAAILGVGAGLSYVGVAFTPADLLLDSKGDPWLHVIFAHWAFRLLFAVSILYAILIIKTENFENKYAYSFIAFGIMVLFYVLYSEMFLNNPREFPDDLIKHVIAQKAIAFWIMFAIYIYSIGLGKYFDKHIERIESDV